MNKKILFLCTIVTALSITTGSFAQSEKASPGAGSGGAGAPATEMAPPSGGDMPASRAEPGASGQGMEQGAPAEGALPSGKSQAQDRSRPRDRSGDTAKTDGSTSGKRDRDGSESTGASDGTAGRESPGAKDRKAADRKGNDRDGTAGRGDAAADSKSPVAKDDAAAGASDGTSGNDDKPKGSVTQLSGEQRTKVQSAFRPHRSEAVVKDIDIRVSIGVTVPRRVSLYAVPQEVIVIAPEYRRYKYFVFEDQVVIVDPATFAIVDVLVLV
jgi:hypothetical protein